MQAMQIQHGQQRKMARYVKGFLEDTHDALWPDSRFVKHIRAVGRGQADCILHEQSLAVHND